MNIQNIDIDSFLFRENLPTLFSLKPAAKNCAHWFPKTDKAPRIELLKKAIEILEKELK